jgi:hypothetical protein
MLRVTLDTNCLIDLEETRPATPHVAGLVQGHHHGQIALMVPAIAASERPKEGQSTGNFSYFTSRLASIGLDSRWRNKKCDVLALWSHLHHQGNVFVTSDTNFHKTSKKPQLIALGAGHILGPTEAATRLS